jgi:hypothetical protein
MLVKGFLHQIILQARKPYFQSGHTITKESKLGFMVLVTFL